MQFPVGTSKTASKSIVGTVLERKGGNQTGGGKGVRGLGRKSSGLQEENSSSKKNLGGHHRTNGV